MSRCRLLAAFIIALYAALDCYWVQGLQLALDPAFSPGLTQTWTQVTGFVSDLTGQVYLSAVSDFVHYYLYDA